jgi:hypothetical protein
MEAALLVARKRLDELGNVNRAWLRNLSIKLIYKRKYSRGSGGNRHIPQNMLNKHHLYFADNFHTI